MNILVDLNILLDYFLPDRSSKFTTSCECIEKLKNNYSKAFISVSSIDNFEFISTKSIKDKNPFLTYKQATSISHKAIKYMLKSFQLAKTPSYINIDYDDIEDSQIIASAKAVNAKVLTRDEKMLRKYSDITLSPKDFLKSKENENINIDFANLSKQHFMYHKEIEKQIDNVVNNTRFILGEEIATLERELEKFTKAKYAITCSSGTDALILALMALDIKQDDEVITTPFTFIATAESIALVGARPVFVDIDEKTYNIDEKKIEEKIGAKTKAIMPVSLYGQPANMQKIEKIAKKHNLKVIVDGAQSFGATFDGKMDSNLGDISCTSFFPAKPLGCYGDGGAVFTNDENLAIKMKQLRVHGQDKRYHHKYIGIGGRMDTLQAAVLLVKLKHYRKDFALRQEVASRYNKALHVKDLILPHVNKNATSAWAQYSVRAKNRDKIQNKLKEKGIPTAVHYPMSLHEQECFRYLGYKTGDFPISKRVSSEILSLPMNPYLSDEEIEYIAKAFS